MSTSYDRDYYVKIAEDASSRKLYSLFKDSMVAHLPATSLNEKDVIILQEAINLLQPDQTLHVKMDGVFGPKSQNAFRAVSCGEDFLSAHDTVLFVMRAFSHFFSAASYVPIPDAKADLSFAKLVLQTALFHHKCFARELPSNKGPFVRMYTVGRSGLTLRNYDVAWCAGFVVHCISQVKEALSYYKVPSNHFSNLPKTLSCDVLARYGKDIGAFVSGEFSFDIEKVKPGDIFLVRKSSTDWVHTGFVDKISVDNGLVTFSTCEGNSNDAGSREGVRVADNIRSARFNPFSGKILEESTWYDFISLPEGV